jgi:colicin import membrane protein
LALICGVLAISAHPIDAPPVATLPVSFISDKDFTQMTKGVKNAPQLKIPDLKPLADKVDAEKSVDQLAPKVADKPAITTDISQSKPEPKPQQKQADKPDKPKPPEYKPDQIADLLKKDTPKDPPKQPDKPAPQQAKTSAKFDANQVAQLLDKREPQRQTASADTINDKPTLGAAAGAQGAQLSQSEIDALRARISSCWSPPPGIDANSKLYVVLRVLFKPDATVAQEPVLVEGTAAALGPALAESAKRSLLLCQPFTMLKPEHYDQWKDIELKFDPHELLGG